jgi:hypothetical protein
LFELIIFGGPLATFLLSELLWFVVETCRCRLPERRGFEVITHSNESPPD